MKQDSKLLKTPVRTKDVDAAMKQAADGPWPVTAGNLGVLLGHIDRLEAAKAANKATIARLTEALDTTLTACDIIMNAADALNEGRWHSGMNKYELKARKVIRAMKDVSLSHHAVTADAKGGGE